MATNNDLNEIMDEIQDVLNRTYYRIELSKHPTKLQRIIASLFFKTKFKRIIKQ